MKHCFDWTGAVNGTRRTLAVLMVVLAFVLGLGQKAAAAPFAYIPNFGSGNMAVVDLATFSLFTTIPLGTNPFGVAVNPAGTRVYVTNLGGLAVSVIDTSTNSSIATITVGDVPTGIAVTPDGARAYVANAGISNAGNTVSVINTANDTVSGTVTVGLGPTGVAAHPSGASVYVTNWTSGTVSVIATASNLVTATIPVGTQPYAVAFNPSGTRAYVTNFGSNSVSVIDTSTSTVLSTVTVGSQPTGIAVRPDGSRIFVSNTGASNISAIDATTLSVSTLSAGALGAPRGLSLNSAGHILFVADSSGGMHQFDAIGGDWLGVIGTGTSPFAVGNFVSANTSLVPPTITSTPPSSVTQGSSLSYDPTVSGSAPFIWRITAGSLPNGVGLNPLTGTISGTPANTGTYSFTLSADNGVNPPATQAITLDVTSPNCVFVYSSGSWTTSNNWTGNCSNSGTPGPTDIVEINNATVTLPSGTLTVGQLILTGVVSLEGAGDPATSLQLTDFGSDWSGASQITFSDMKLVMLSGSGAYSSANLTFSNASWEIQSSAFASFGSAPGFSVFGSTSVVRVSGELSLDGGTATFSGGARLVNETAGTITNEFTPLTITGPFENRGVFNAEFVTFSDAADYTQTAPTARLRVSGTLVGSNGELTIDSGSVVSGSGGGATLDFVGVVNNGATFRPASLDDGIDLPRTMTITGDYTQGPAGALELRWCSVASVDKLAVLGNATLDGTVEVKLGIACSPTLELPDFGDSLDAVSFSTRTGVFSQLLAPNGFVFLANYGISALTLTFEEPTPPKQLTVSPSGFSFTNQLVGSSSAQINGTVTNTGTDPLAFRSSAPSVPTAPFNVDLAGCFNATLTSGQSCNFSVTFSPTSAGASSVDIQPFIAAAVTDPSADVTPSPLMATGTGVNPSPPSVTLAFSPPTRNVSVPTTLTVTLTNTNPTAANGADFVLTYPIGLNNSSVPNATTNCGGGIAAATPGGTTLVLSSGTIPSAGSCTVSVSVVSGTADTYTVSLGAGSVTTVGFGSNTAAASAILVVSSPGSAPWQSDSVLAGGGTHSLGLRSNGEVWSWGTDNGNALGRANGATNTPSPVTTLGTSVRSVAAAAWYSLALKTDGSVWAWGYGPNVGAAVGQPAAGTIPLPTQVLGVSGAVAVSTRYTHSLVLLGDGSVWGFGPEGSLALGPTTGNNGSRQVPGVSNARQVAAGEQHSLALLDDGTVRAWGANAASQLGVNTSGAPTSTPQTVPITGVTQIAASSFASLALKSDGTVWWWGSIAGGLTPVQVAGLSGVVAIKAGNYNFFALLGNGTVMGWGDNTFGRVGSGAIGGTISTPVALPGLSSISAISGGEFHGLAATSAGAVFAWGNNGNRQRCGLAGGDSGTPTACGFSLSAVAAPVSFRIASTGLDALGNLLPDGAPDSLYTLTLSADPAFPAPRTPVVADMTANTYWLAQGPNSKWIAPSVDQSYPAAPNPCTAAGDYTYRTTFDLTGYDHTTASISGAWAVDNSGLAVKLNGAIVSGVTSPGYSALSSFSISSGFQSGVNTLEFLINDSSCPGGLRVELSGTAVKTSATAPSITSGSLPAGSVGASYSFTPSASGTPSAAWAIIGGVLPPGLTLNAASGAISGTPTTAGSYTFTLVAANGISPNAQQSATIVVAGLAPPTITFVFSPSSILVGGTSVGTLTVSNSNATALTGAPFTFTYFPVITNAATPAESSTCVGATPVAVPGVNSSSTSTSFTIPANGSCTFSVTVTSSTVGVHAGNVSAGLISTSAGGTNSTPFSLTVTAAPVACSPGSYSATGQTPCTPASPGSFVSGSGATTQTACTIGTFSSTSGALSCTPASPGSFVATVGASSQSACAVGTFSATTGAATCTPAATGSFVPTAGASSSSLCAPGSYQPSTGQSSCIPASANFFVANAGATTQTACPGGQTSPPGATSCSSGTPPVITSAAPPSGLVGTAYSFTFAATGTAPITWGVSSGTLPPGLTLNSGTGVLSGNPTTAGTYTFVVSATNTAGTVTQGTAVTIAVPIVPAISVSPTQLEFGNQVVETTSSPQAITVSNTGNGPFDITSISFVGDFAYNSDCPRTLQPNASCTLSVTFTPLVAGVRNGRISVNNTASAGNSGINLAGTGVLAPRANMIVTPAGGLSFSSQAIGTNSAPQAIYISNTGQLDLQIALSLTGAPQFTRVAALNADNPNNLPECGGSVTAFAGLVRAGTSCILGIRFNPTVLGTVLGSLNITHNGSATGALVQTNVPFTGTGTQRLEALIRVSGGLNFADTVVDRTGATRLVTVSNTGTIDLTVGTLVIVPGNANTSAEDFTVVNRCTAAVSPNSNCTIDVTFTPKGAVGAKSASLVVQSNAANASNATPSSANSVSLFGTALAVPQPLVRLSATSVGFGSTVVPKVIGPRDVTLTNAGNEALTLQGLVLTSSGGAAEAPAFTMSTTAANACRLSQSLLPGQSCVLSLTYTATAIGSRTGTLTITSNAPSSPDRVQLSGSGCLVSSGGLNRFFVPTTSCGQ